MSERINLHAYPSSIERESRMLKETAAIASAGLVDSVVLVGTRENNLPISETIDGRRSLRRISLLSGNRRSNPFLRVCQILEWQLRVFLTFRSKRVVLFNAHNFAALPIGIAFRFAQGTRVVYDTHELETERHWPWIISQLAKLLEKWLVRWTDLIVVVSDATGRWYRERYRRSTVIAVRNFPMRTSFSDESNDALRQELGIGRDGVLFIYQGLLAAGRGIETLIRVFDRAPSDRHILFLGFGALEQAARVASSRCENIHFRPAVSPGEISHFTCAADVGFHLLDKSSLNHSMTVGNKPFEYLACGVPVIESAHTEVARLIGSLGCAWLVGDEEAEILELVSSVTRDEIESRKEMARQARQRFTWEGEIEPMLVAYEGLLSTNSGADASRADRQERKLM